MGTSPFQEKKNRGALEGKTFGVSDPTSANGIVNCQMVIRVTPNLDIKPLGSKPNSLTVGTAFFRRDDPRERWVRVAASRAAWRSLVCWACNFRTAGGEARPFGNRRRSEFSSNVIWGEKPRMVNSGGGGSVHPPREVGA